MKINISSLHVDLILSQRLSRLFTTTGTIRLDQFPWYVDDELVVEHSLPDRLVYDLYCL